MSSERHSRVHEEEGEGSETLLNGARHGSSSLHVDLQHLTQATWGLDVPTNDRLMDFVRENRKLMVGGVVALLSAAIVAIIIVSASPGGEEEEHELRMNQIQMLGTHNSYHISPSEAVLNLLRNIKPSWNKGLSYADGFAYTHPPLPDQLMAGYRHLELDVFYDPDGGRFSHRAILALLGLPTASNDPRLEQPGFKVIHMSDIDFNSTCVTFVECLQLIKKFSDELPDHLPISIKTQVKEEHEHLVPNQTESLPITPDVLLDLEKEILSVFPRSRIVTPDDVKGWPSKTTTLRWPKLKDARGKIIFLLITNDSIEQYLKIPRSPRGRVLFPTYAPEGDGDARAWEFHALSIEEASAATAAAVAGGRYAIGRADANTEEARASNFTRGAAHMRYGTQVIQTDYPVFEGPNPFGTPYVVMFGGNVQARCNPMSAPGWCFSKEAALVSEGRRDVPKTHEETLPNAPP